MRIVLDTNVLMSGVYFGGIPGRIVEAWVSGRVEVVLSPQILDEYRRVGADLAVRYSERADALGPLLTLLALSATVVNAPPLSERVSSDSDDDMFLAAAVAADAKSIVSRDMHLLDVSGWRGIDVLTPRRFVNRYLSAG